MVAHSQTSHVHIGTYFTLSCCRATSLSRAPKRPIHPTSVTRWRSVYPDGDPTPAVCIKLPSHGVSSWLMSSAATDMSRDKPAWNSHVDSGPVCGRPVSACVHLHPSTIRALPSEEERRQGIPGYIYMYIYNVIARA